MSRLQLPGSSSQPTDDIEDAEFVEVDDSQAHPRRDGTSPSSHQSTTEWWDEMHIAGKLIAVGTLLFFCLLVADATGGGATQSAETAQADAGEARDGADQMLAQWAQRVIGTPSTAGFNLIDGGGAAGASCSEGDATRLLQFGKAGVDDDEPVPNDFFMMLIAGSDISVGGAFWFDSHTSELTVRNARTVDSKKPEQDDVPEKTFAVEGGGDGTVRLDGATYRVCELRQ